MAVISADTFDPLRRYVRVRLQQGVPIVDADVNEREDIQKFELRAFLKWFVGDGVPEGNDGFLIVATGQANDFEIRSGVSGPAEAMSRIGRCLVQGMDVMIDADIRFADQSLHESKGTAADALATRLGVPKIAALATATADGTVVAYLDVWERLVTPSEDPALVLAGLGTESCARVKREWVVRIRAGTGVPAPGDTDYLPGHAYYALATIRRRAGDPLVQPGDVSDRRERRLLVPPATLIEDVLGTNPADYRVGGGRPQVSLREAINALLQGGLPSTAPVPIAPGPALDTARQAPVVGPDNHVNMIWHSNRTDNVNQVFASRWDVDDPAARDSTVTVPLQLTSGPDRHENPAAIVLPGGDLLVAYQTAGQDIHFKRAPFAELPAAADQPVAVDGSNRNLFPFVVRSGSWVAFFWIEADKVDPHPRWMVRVRQYTPTWTEAEATWGPPTQLSPTATRMGGLGAGEFHAAADEAEEIWAAFHTEDDMIQAVRFNPATGDKSQPSRFVVPDGSASRNPFVVIDGDLGVWVLWDAGQRIFLQRFQKDVEPPQWEATATAVPVAATGSDTSPAAIRDGTGVIWFFWSRSRPGPASPVLDLVLSRHHPLTGWRDPFRVSEPPFSGPKPMAVQAPSGGVLLFWTGGDGQSNLFFRQVITSL
jgi:Family of unknown function (DUF6519)